MTIFIRGIPWFLFLLKNSQKNMRAGSAMRQITKTIWEQDKLSGWVDWKKWKGKNGEWKKWKLQRKD